MPIRRLPEARMPAGRTAIWRYMRYEYFAQMLREGRLYFASAREFTDPFEGALPALDAKRRREIERSFDRDVSRAFEELRRLHRVSCWHMNNGESAAMWDLYLRDGKGIANRTTISRLKNALQPYRIQPDYGIEDFWMGAVRYIDYRTQALRGDGFYGPFFHKRRSFAHEREFRVLVSLRMAEEFGVQVPEFGIKVDTDMSKLVHSIYLVPQTTAAFRHRVETLVARTGLKAPIHQSELEDVAVY